jgi:hypothetical protein
MKAYFYTKDEAERAATRLGVSMSVTPPRPVVPVNGRPWMIEITYTPQGLSQYPNPTESSRIVGIVFDFNGIVHTQDQP